MLDDLFSNLVEAVSEVGKREEECRVVERETDRLLRWQDGTARFQVRLVYDWVRLEGAKGVFVLKALSPSARAVLFC